MAQSVKFDINMMNKDEVLSKADFLTLHVPAQKDFVIGTKEIELMKDGAGLINAARGGVVDEVALVKALKSGKLAFAGIDTFENEPTPAVQVLMTQMFHLLHILVLQQFKHKTESVLN